MVFQIERLQTLDMLMYRKPQPRFLYHKTENRTSWIYMYQEFEGTKGVIRIRKSNKDRQYNGQKKRTNNELKNITQKTKDRVIRTPIKPGVY